MTSYENITVVKKQFKLQNNIEKLFPKPGHLHSIKINAFNIHLEI